MQIKFSHSYPKLHGQESALLVAVELRGRSDFSEKFIEYDTAFDGGHYPLPPAQYMVLVFLGNELIPFTTVRRWTEEKFRYYHNAIGQTFEIVRVVAAKAAESAPTSTNTGMAGAEPPQSCPACHGAGYHLRAGQEGYANCGICKGTGNLRHT